MRVNVYAKPGAAANTAHTSGYLLAAVEGLKRHDIVCNILPYGRPEPCDLAIVWGVRKLREMHSGKRCLIFERGYVGDRNYWTSIGFDGLNGRAEFYNDNMPGDRWEKLFARYMKPWRTPAYEGEYILILAQKPGDASLRGLDAQAWAIGLQVRAGQQRIASRIRWHPKANGYSSSYSSRRTITITGSLEFALSKARWAISFNSNSTVDAVLAGVPAVTFDKGAMAWDVTGREPYKEPPTPDRTQWAHNLAYTQWSLHEIAAGMPFDHLKQAIMELK